MKKKIIIKKIVYLIEQPLDERNYDRFGIQTWIDRDWIVEIWDLTPWAFPQVWQNFIESGRKFKVFTGYFPIVSKKQLKDRCSSLEYAEYFIDQTGENQCSLRAKFSLIRTGAVRVVCVAGSMPAPVLHESLTSKLRRLFAAGPLKGFERLAHVFLRKLAAPFTKPGLVIVSGTKSISSTVAPCKILRAHNFDYDIYLKLGEKIGMAAGEYAVFIDQNYCFHPDLIYEEISFIVSPEKYFPAICNALKSISEILNVGVTVAAHPRSSYGERGVDYFKGYPIECGKTAELIRDCKVVVCHDSTAIQFAVLYEKPLIFLTTNELAPLFEGKSITAFAFELGKSVINIDNDLDEVDWKKELYIDSEKYDEYRKKYIKIDGSPKIPFWEILVDYIESECVGVSPLQVSGVVV